MNTIEDGARAAMRAIAETVTDAPPLRLDSARLQLPQSAQARRADELALRMLPSAAKLAADVIPRTGRMRRFPAWLAPLSAAAAVVAVAISLVVLKIHPNEAVVPASVPVSVPAGSVPRYFVELDPIVRPLTGSASDGVLIADTYTGKQVATVAAPAGLTFTSVSAASDDRTFVLFATTTASTHSTGTWYELRIAPGTAHPAALTRLPIRALPGVDAMAVSGSGRELAVVQGGYGHTTQYGTYKLPPDVLSIYSLATGQVLHSWSTPWTSRVLPYFPTNLTGPLANWPVLTWVDGDRGITYPGQPLPLPYGPDGKPRWTVTMRQLDVTATGNSLGADSRVVWREQDIRTADKYGCIDYGLAVSPDGRTFVCASRTGEANGDKLMKWLAYGSGVNPVARLLYQTTSNMGSGSTGYDNGMGDNDVVLWTSNSGSTMIVLWYRFSFSNTFSISGNGTTAAVQFGVISDGRFSPLPTSLITTPTLWSQTAIAW